MKGSPTIPRYETHHIICNFVSSNSALMDGLLIARFLPSDATTLAVPTARKWVE